MSIKARSLRHLMKECGPDYKNRLRECLGIEMRESGAGRFPSKYNPSKAQIGADEFSIKDLAEEFLGGEFVAGLHNGKTSDHYTAEFREASNPVTASTMQNINAFNATVGGLIEVKVLQGYESPEFIGEKLVENMPTSVNGGKLIGHPNVVMGNGPVAEGQEYPRVGLGERWVTCQKNLKRGLGLSLSREVIVYNLSPELLAAAQTMGDSLARTKEIYIAAVVQGVDIDAGTDGFDDGYVANSFIYKGAETDTPNATYQTSAGTGASLKYNYVNQLQNVMADYTDFQNVQQKLNLMREPETNYPITAPFEDVIVSPNALYAAKIIINATQVLSTTGTNGLSGVGAGTFAGNPIPNVNVYASPIWNKVLVDSGLSQANADVYWYGGSFRKAFVWRSVWDLNVVQSNPMSSDLLSRDIVNEWFASWLGVPVVRDPHYVVNSTN